MKRFYKRKKTPADKALVLAKRSIQLLFAYTEQSSQPLPKEELDKLANIMRMYHSNFISAEYIHHYQCARAKRYEDMHSIDYRLQ